MNDNETCSGRVGSVWGVPRDVWVVVEGWGRVGVPTEEEFTWTRNNKINLIETESLDFLAEIVETDLSVQCIRDNSSPNSKSYI